jgi:hypothetical protein
MYLEGLTVCVNYADFLAETLPHNLVHFNRFVVITTHADRETQDLCQSLSVECRPTDQFSRDGDSFNKGAAIDWGMGYLSRKEWICHLDADIYLPPMSRRWLEQAHLDTDSIYGVDRVNCVGYAPWKRYISGSRDLQHKHHCLVEAPPFPLSSRIALAHHRGYLPIGFFQLWHGKHRRRYPSCQGDAEHTDVLHALQWPIGRRHLIEEVICVHLESEPAPMGANWKGRRTKRFGPDFHVHQHHHKHPCCQKTHYGE